MYQGDTPADRYAHEACCPMHVHVYYHIHVRVHYHILLYVYMYDGLNVAHACAATL